MSTDETYNGWTNRETWAVALHINNEQGWQESVLDALREACDAVECTCAPAVTLSLHEPECPVPAGKVPAYVAGDIIRDNVENVTDDAILYGNPDGLNALRDIGSMWRVNWTELGASFLDDLDNA